MPTAALSTFQADHAACRSDRVAHLDRLGTDQRLAHYYAGRFDQAELWAWAARYPEEVPTVNGEFEWIGLRLADLD